jgi:hypothetical protein
MRLILAMVMLAGLSGAAPDWTRTVTQTGAGAYVLGNPKAKVRVIEYLSYTCNHCAQFVAEGGPPMKAQYIAKGSVALEVRTAVRDRLDFVMALSARCGGAARFHGNHDALFAAQPKLFEQATAFKPVAGQPVDVALKAYARGSGVAAVMAKRGIAPAQLDACLTSKAAQAPVLGMAKDAWETRKIPYTPYILINNVEAPGASWDKVGPAIGAALAS